MTTRQDLLALAVRRLPEYSAQATRQLLADCAEQPLAWTQQDAPASAELVTQFNDWVRRAESGEPLAYICGLVGFWTLTLRVTPDVLIPRPDTETLVELALAAEDDAPRRVLDLGTGSGAIALALAAERPQWYITATDLSNAAIAVAQDNANRLALPITLHQGAWFDAIEAEQQFDLIVSNPPYVLDTDPDLDDTVRAHEPHAALFSGTDGLGDIRKIVDGAPPHLAPNGWLAIEHGHRQGDAVAHLLTAQGFSAVATVKDLAGQPRVTHGRWAAT